MLLSKIGNSTHISPENRLLWKLFEIRNWTKNTFFVIFRIVSVSVEYLPCRLNLNWLCEKRPYIPLIKSTTYSVDSYVHTAFMSIKTQKNRQNSVNTESTFLLLMCAQKFDHQSRIVRWHDYGMEFSAFVCRVSMHSMLSHSFMCFDLFCFLFDHKIIVP